MTITEIVLLIIIGLFSGIFAGFFGIGGGVLVIPALVFLLGMSQHQAQGTSVALLLPPLGILAVINYAKEGYVNWKYVLVLALTFVIGAYIGSHYSIRLPEKILQKIFGVFLLLVALKIIFSK